MGNTEIFHLIECHAHCLPWRGVVQEWLITSWGGLAISECVVSNRIDHHLFFLGFNTLSLFISL